MKLFNIFKRRGEVPRRVKAASKPSRFSGAKAAIAAGCSRCAAGLQTLYVDVKEFCMNTTIQGLRHVVDEKTHPVERVFWMGMVVMVCFLAKELGLTQVNRFSYSPTVVSIRKDYREWTTSFPAITVCLTDRVDAALSDEYIKATWNVTQKDAKYNYYTSFVRLVATVSFRSNLRLFWKFEKDQSLVGLSLMGVAVAVQPRVGMRVRLHESDFPVHWEPVMTEMGICRTFNSIFSRYQSVETWRLQLKSPNSFSPERPISDLLTCHYMNRQCFARFSLLNSTGQYYIHSPFEIAETTSKTTGLVEESEEMEAQFRVLQIAAGPGIESLNLRQRGCKYPSEPVSDTIPAYSNAMCQIECRNRMALVFCDCRPFFYTIGAGKPCDTQGMACIGRNTEILVNLPTNLARCQCVPQCTEVNYVPQDMQLTYWNASRRSLFERRASVRISLQMPKILMNKELIFTFEDLIASLGGVGALFLGASFVSVVELLLCLCRPARRGFEAVRERRSRRQQARR